MEGKEGEATFVDDSVALLAAGYQAFKKSGIIRHHGAVQLGGTRSSEIDSEHAMGLTTLC